MLRQQAFVLVALCALPGTTWALLKGGKQKARTQTGVTQNGPRVVPLDAIKLMRAEMCAQLLHKMGSMFNTDIGDCMEFMNGVCHPGKDQQMDGDNKRERSTGQGYCKLFFPSDEAAFKDDEEEEAQVAEMEEERAKEEKMRAEEEELAAQRAAAKAEEEERAAARRAAAKREAAERAAAEQAARDAEAAAAAKRAAERAAAEKAAAERAAAEEQRSSSGDGDSDGNGSGSGAGGGSGSGSGSGSGAGGSAGDGSGAGGAGGDGSGAGGAGGDGSGSGAGADGAGGAGDGSGAGGAGGDGSGSGGGDGSGAGAGDGSAGGAPSPAGGGAPSPAGAGAPSFGARNHNPRWWAEMDEGKEQAEQGFSGPPVAHNDMETFPGDWRTEYGKYKMDMVKICKEHPTNVWCVKHASRSEENAYGQPVHFHASGAVPNLPGASGAVHFHAGGRTTFSGSQRMGIQFVMFIVAISTLHAWNN